MQAIAQGEFNEAQVLEALNAAGPRWAFPVAQLDYGLRFERWLPDTAILSWHATLDADSQPHTGSATITVAAAALADVDLYNTYFQFYVAVMMRQPASANDLAAFAMWPQLIGRVTDGGLDIDETGAETLSITTHDLSELLNDEITNEYVANEGDVVTTKIKDVLAMSYLAGRINVVTSTETFAKAHTWPAGTTIAQIITDSCAEIDFIAYVDTYGYLNCRPKQDPATAPQLIGYSDQREDRLLVGARLHRDVFGIPNHLTEISTALDDEAHTTWTATKQNTNPNSPISSTRLKSLTGAPLIRHRVKTGVEAASQAILQSKTDNDLREISTVAETLDYGGNYKPYHQLFDVFGLTRAAFGYADVGFEIRKIDIDANNGMTFQARRNIALA